MSNPAEGLKKIARRRSLKNREKNPASTSILPLDEIKSAVVFFDADIPGCAQTIALIQDYFTSRGKKVTVFALSLGAQLLSEGMQKATFIHKDNINWFGRIKRGKRHPATDMQEDLFVSLFESDKYPVEYAARCSKARFKAGRSQLSGDTYDLVIVESEGRHLSQNQAFDAIMKFISMIQY